MESLTVKDHSVSGEEFQLVFDEVLEMYKTEPQPSLEKLGSYYESEDYISHTDAKRNLFEKSISLGAFVYAFQKSVFGGTLHKK